MRQIVSLIRDDQVHYALVDEDDGSLIPFASITLPDPERFGLHEAAVLGTNLINALALGVNGTRRPPRAATSPVEAPRALSAPEPPAHPETARERKLRLARERGRSSSTTPKKTKTKGGAEWYVTPESIIAIVDQYPEGIRVREVAERLWRESGRTDEQPSWMYGAVMNRLLQMRLQAKQGRAPMPLREEDRPTLNKDGVPSKLVGRYLVPLRG